MKNAPIAGLVSETKKPKLKADGFAVQVSGDQATAIDWLVNTLRDAERAATGRSLSKTDAREQVLSMILEAFLAKTPVLVKVYDEDAKWEAHIGDFPSWAALVSVLPKEGGDQPDNINENNNAEPEGDGKNQESLALNGDEDSAGTRDAESETGNENLDSSSDEELDEMGRLEREITGGA